jgi:pimeloyl-ACP methyl ester carboxylesterase
LTAVRIIFIPGLKPKPPPDAHRRELWRVMLGALARARPDEARFLAERPECFSLVGWTYLFYRSHRDIDLDLPGIERLLTQHGPTDADLREIGSLGQRLRRLRHIVGDSLPFLGRWMAEPALRLAMLEASRYLSNRDRVADTIRDLLRAALEAAWSADEKVLLIGHSLGSVIAYDTLWELSHAAKQGGGRVDLFITLGSPLATQFIRRSLRGATETGRKRYPTDIRRWVNFSAKGDVTALYPRLTPFFQEMLNLGLVESLEDHVDLENHFRTDIGLNVHESYGYLAHPLVAGTIADWLAGVRN